VKDLFEIGRWTFLWLALMSTAPVVRGDLASVQALQPLRLLARLGTQETPASAPAVDEALARANAAPGAPRTLPTDTRITPAAPAAEQTAPQPRASTDEALLIRRPGAQAGTMLLSRAAAASVAQPDNATAQTAAPQEQAGVAQENIILASHTPAEQPAGEAASVAPSTGTLAPIGTGTYTVQQGDTLYSIARRAGISASTLQRANGINNANRITVGQALVIPAPGSVPSTNYASDSTAHTTSQAEQQAATPTSGADSVAQVPATNLSNSVGPSGQSQEAAAIPINPATTVIDSGGASGGGSSNYSAVTTASANVPSATGRTQTMPVSEVRETRQAATEATSREQTALSDSGVGQSGFK
jgi:LysM repeat protein